MSETKFVGCWLAHSVTQLYGRLQGRLELLKCAGDEAIDAIRQPRCDCLERKR